MAGEAGAGDEGERGTGMGKGMELEQVGRPEGGPWLEREWEEEVMLPL